MALALIIALPFLGICLPLLLERFGRSACAFGAGIAPLTALILLLSKRADVFAGQTEIVHYSWLPGLGLNLSLRLDGLGFLFALLILGTSRPRLSIARSSARWWSFCARCRPSTT